MLDEYEGIHRPSKEWGRHPKTAVCTERASGEACDALVYGSLVLGLVSKGLYPRASAEAANVSVDALRDHILSIKIKHYPTESPRYGSVPQHEHCGGKDFSEKVAKVLADPKSPVLDSHLVHMKAQNSSVSS